MSEPDDRPVTGEVEQRLAALLRQLADEPPTGAPVQESVLATVRWQSAVREAAVSIGGLAAGAVEAVALVLGIRRSGGTRP